MNPARKARNQRTLFRWTRSSRPIEKYASHGDGAMPSVKQPRSSPGLLPYIECAFDHIDPAQHDLRIEARRQ
uniref:Uncharacterized protein n=1 Tax=Candidatus Kentrum sp. TC TaxID=2126339 RepID=A0A450Z1M9_9GAMM|nr:MAG: hypothetical protein BECKTC1821D_GA0114238_10503 [Candidatus Kentron sp. TC]VFK61107.1 MAG: hypothetical protein BECKTC1821F_GA0114240_105315 [Candidatus Kentron sp. TC]